MAHGKFNLHCAEKVPILPASRIRLHSAAAYRRILRVAGAASRGRLECPFPYLLPVFPTAAHGGPFLRDHVSGAARKALMGRACKFKKEETMVKVINPSDLRGRSFPELRALFREAQQELVRSDRGSQERRAALANVEAIGLAMARRLCP